MMTGGRRSFHDMECIPESPCGSPVFYSGVSYLEVPIGGGPTSRFSSSQNDLSDNLLTTPIQSLESRVLRLCNKKHASRDPSDNTEHGRITSKDHSTTLPERFSNQSNKTKHCSSWQGQFRKPFQQYQRLNSEIPETPAPIQNFSSSLNLFVSKGDISKLSPHDTTFEELTNKHQYNAPDIIIERPTSLDAENTDENTNTLGTPEEDELSNEQDRKQAICWAKDQLIKIQEEDRKLLMQFIEIRFRIESLGGKNWSRATSLSSYRDLSTLGTLPRSPTVNDDAPLEFRQRALSLRNPKIELSPQLLRHQLMMEDAPLV